MAVSNVVATKARPTIEAEEDLLAEPKAVSDDLVPVDRYVNDLICFPIAMQMADMKVWAHRSARQGFQWALAAQ